MEKICPLIDRECIAAKCEMFHCGKQMCMIKLFGKLLFAIKCRTTQIRNLLDESEGEFDND